MSNDCNVWCPDVYKNIFIDRVNDDQLRVGPCCQADQVIENVENFDFESSPYLTNIRQDFDRGTFAPACHRCQNDELVGKHSRRLSVIDFYENMDRKIALESIDFSSTWACNLACIMCNEQYSSTWAVELNIPDDRLRVLGRKINKSKNFLNQLDLSQIKRIHFNGGEPLINDDHLLILKQLQTQGTLGTVAISYNTNGTQYPSDAAIDLWSQAKLVKLYFSIDAVEQAFEYIRWPAKWTQTKENLLKLRENMPSNVMFGFNVTVGCYNIFEIADVLTWFKYNYSTNREHDHSDFVYQIANNFDPKFLSAKAKHAAIQHLSGHDEFQGIVTHLKNFINYNVPDQWYDKLDAIDQRRGNDWKQILKVAEFY